MAVLAARPECFIGVNRVVGVGATTATVPGLGRTNHENSATCFQQSRVSYGAGLDRAAEFGGLNGYL